MIFMSKNDLKKRIACGIIFIVIGLSFLLNDYVVAKREKAFSKMNLELSELFNKEKEEANKETQTSQAELTSTTESQTSTPAVTEQSNDDYQVYAGILQIPKINFEKGFYKKESDLNNVKFNLKILNESSYPDEDKGNVIIIGHSGNYSNSYFGNLYQLVVGDTASITYQEKKYQYKIVNIYTDKKDGTVTIYRDETKSTLTLITCTKDDETTQTIYIFELVGVE